jgi:hypothetical protein
MPRLASEVPSRLVRSSYVNNGLLLASVRGRRGRGSGVGSGDSGIGSVGKFWVRFSWRRWRFCSRSFRRGLVLKWGPRRE